MVRSDRLGGVGEVRPLKISCLSVISWQKCPNRGSFSWSCCRDPSWLEHCEEQALEVGRGVAVWVGGDSPAVPLCRAAPLTTASAAGMGLALLDVEQEPDPVVAPRVPVERYLCV